MTHSLTYNDMLGAYAPYPAPIRPYLLRAATHPLFSSMLTKSFMRVFIDILGRAPIADPCRPLKLRVDMVAEKLDISTKTVTRAIRFLQNRGWLSHHANHDGRNNQGEFCAREFILGTELRHMLGLPTDISTQNYSATLTKNTTLNIHQDHDPLPCSTEALTQATKPLTTPAETSAALPSETNFAANLTMQPDPLSSSNPIYAQEQVTEAPIATTPVLESTNTEFFMDKATTKTKMSHGLYIGVNKIFLKEASFKEEAFQIKNQQIKSKSNVDLTSEEHMEATIGIITHNELNSRLEISNTMPSTPTTPKQPKLPEDLTEMANILQLNPWGICALMRLAKQMNQRLQDVWYAKREQILNAQATGGRAYRYIQFLLQTGEDFAWRAKQSMMPKPASDASVSGTTSTTRPTPEKTTYSMYRNKRFTGNNGVQVSIQGDGSAIFTSEIHKNVYVCPADMNQIYEAITAGKLWPLAE